jgi:hypothetical protein
MPSILTDQCTAVFHTNQPIQTTVPSISSANGKSRTSGRQRIKYIDRSVGFSDMLTPSVSTAGYPAKVNDRLTTTLGTGLAPQRNSESITV